MLGAQSCEVYRRMARGNLDTDRRASVAVSIAYELGAASPHIQLELLEAPVVHTASRTPTHPAVALIFNQSFHTGPTQTANTIGAGVALF